MDAGYKIDPACILDEMLANSERDVFVFQPPRDIPLRNELNLHNPDGLLEYQYRELQPGSIRLLEYSDRSDSNEVSFHLREASLEKVDGKFIAISYCWGGESQPKKSLPISSNTYLEINETFHSLLRHVAGVASDLPVWVDAI